MRRNPGLPSPSTANDFRLDERHPGLVDTKVSRKWLIWDSGSRCSPHSRFLDRMKCNRSLKSLLSDCLGPLQCQRVMQGLNLETTISFGIGQ
mmetsp:Transcript_3764/g.7198  ORF Transcript_3764/g.7198 Transcript_3764/m.7198 type:complete len:92 (+) Transcript_3764:1338-1613(+)